SRENHLVARPAGMTGRFRQTVFNKLKCAFAPVSRLEMIRNRLSEIDHDADYGSIDCRRYFNWHHGTSFCVNSTLFDTEVPQSVLNEIAEPCWKVTDIARRQQQWKQRS